MTKNEKKKDIIEVLTEFLSKTRQFDVELSRLKQLPYIRLANKHLGDVVEQSLEELKLYKKLYMPKDDDNGR